MSLPPDDLPHAPSGRVPQWVVDEAAGRTATSVWPYPDPVAAWSPPPPPPRRRRPVLRSALTLAVVAALAWSVTSGTAAGLWDTALRYAGVPSEPPAVPPTPAVVALADEAFLTEEGREIFYGTHPEVLRAEAFAGRCEQGQGARLPATGVAVGCYHQATDSVVLYEPADPRLRGYLVETAAHELLHAAWVRLTDNQRADLVPLLEAAIASVPAADPVHGQVAGSVGSHPESRPTELFAYLGTQVRPPGGLDTTLETVYARFVADRTALVEVHEGWLAALDQMSTDLAAAAQSLRGTLARNAQDRAQLAADQDSLAYYRQAYEEKAAEVAALPAEQRERLRLSWVWWDGTELPMAPAVQTLAAAAELLARDDAALPQRDAVLTAAEAAAETERVRIETMRADLEALQAQLDPGTGG